MSFMVYIYATNSIFAVIIVMCTKYFVETHG
nr:MAG TPA_asm: hypothetical protein [Caudoviricetes sp.]